MPLVVYTIPREAKGRRLDQVLAELCQELSRSQLKALMEEGQVTIGGQSVKSSQKVKGDEQVEVNHPEKAIGLVAQELPLQILYEDQDIVVVNKAPGMVVHPAPGVPDGTLVNALLFHIKDLTKIEGELRPGIVHRLDRDTSGCLVVAKNETAFLSLQEAFHERRLDKFYLALCHGVPTPTEFTLDTPYGRNERDRTKYTTRNPQGAERRAVSHVKVLETFSASALVQVKLETGRTHQIRVHLFEAGHPLLADSEYGGAKREAKLPVDSLVRRAAESIGRQALHAWRLSFVHPITGAQLSFEAPIPEDFQGALTLLRGGLNP
jgi:23S rRNA pseudouridine1911/1915/1917 synthase